MTRGVSKRRKDIKMDMDKYLIDRGYAEYPPSSIDSRIVVAMFQKRFDDKFGKKYFINVKKNTQDFIPAHQRGDWWEPFSYTYEVQISIGEDDKTINLEFFSNWNVESVEQFMEEFFNKMKPNYYELFENEERHVRPEEKTASCNYFKDGRCLGQKNMPECTPNCGYCPKNHN
jgi:hypothetical protein